MTIRERFKDALSRVDPEDLYLKRKLRFLVSTKTFLAFVSECHDQARVTDGERYTPDQATYNGVLLMTSGGVGIDEIRVVRIVA